MKNSIHLFIWLTTFSLLTPCALADSGRQQDENRAMVSICSALDQDIFGCSISIKLDEEAGETQRAEEQRLLLASATLVKAIHATKAHDRTSDSWDSGTHRSGISNYRLGLSGTFTPLALQSLLQAIQSNLALLGDKLEIVLSNTEFSPMRITSDARTLEGRSGIAIKINGGVANLEVLTDIIEQLIEAQEGILSNTTKISLSTKAVRD